jgi:hypothetical protein
LHDEIDDNRADTFGPINTGPTYNQQILENAVKIAISITLIEAKLAS